MTHFPDLPVWWELDGTTWNNGADSAGNRLLVQFAKGWTNSRPPRPDVKPRPNADGAYIGPNRRGAKIVELVGKTVSLSPLARQELNDQIAALCGDADTFYPLTRHEHGRSLTMWVKLNDEIDITERRDGITLDVNLQLIAPDGIKYTEDNPSQSTALASPAPGGILWNGTPTVSGGTEWNGTSSVTGGLIYESGAGTGGSLTLTNSGTAWAPILLQVTPTPAVTDPSILDASSGRRITYDGELTSGVLEIDTGTTRTSLGGINVGGQLSDAEFFLVPPRSSIQLLFTAAAGSAVLSATNANAFA